MHNAPTLPFLSYIADSGRRGAKTFFVFSRRASVGLAIYLCTLPEPSPLASVFTSSSETRL